MRLTVHTIDGESVTIENVDDLGSVQPLIEAFRDEDVTVLAFTLDDAMTYVLKRNIVRIDVD